MFLLYVKRGNVQTRNFFLSSATKIQTSTLITHMPGYHEKGGGLCFIYKVNFHAKKIDSAQTDTFEMKTIELKLNSKPYRFIVVYYIPGTSSLEFNNEFSEKVLALALDYEEVICLGDFNLHFNTRNKYANLILELFQTLELSARVYEPTHKHVNTLDQVFLPTLYESCPMIVQQLDFSDDF